MVLSFRVSELQLLLGLTSQSRCGRKTELLERALAMVDRGVSPAVQLKIRELYERFTPHSSGSIPSAHQQSSSSRHATTSLSSSSRSLLMSSHHPTASSNALGRTNGVHRGLSELLIQQQRSQIPTHPDVKYKHLPFYDVLGEIMRPTSLVPKTPAKPQELRLTFALSEQHVKDITAARDMRGAPDRIDFIVQVQLRFCILDSTCRQPDFFPSNIAVKVNGVPATLPNPIPTNKPGVEPKRPGRPVDITKICRLSPSTSNSLVITYNADDTKCHCVAIYLVKRLDSNILLNRLRRAGTLKVEQTKQLIRDKLSLDQDTDLATTSLRASLLCPLGKMRMTVPCRASTCNHLQCFDGPTFLQMNEKKPTWMCPVCDKPAEFNRLVIDGLFLEVIRSSVDSTEIELTRDGQWKVTERLDESDDESPPNSPNPFMPQPSKSNMQTGSVGAGGDNNTAPSSGGNAACIDLTDNDEDAMNHSSHSHNNSSSSGTTTTVTHTETVSSSRNSTCQPGDISPLNIPIPSPPPPPPPPISPPPPPSHDCITPPPPLPPMAHQSYTPFTLSKLPSVPRPPLPPGFTPAPPAHSGGIHNPYLSGAGGGYGASSVGGAYDSSSGMIQPAMMDFMSLMAGMPEYSVGQVPQYGGAYDYLYGQPPRLDSATDREHRNGHESPDC